MENLHKGTDALISLREDGYGHYFLTIETIEKEITMDIGTKGATKLLADLHIADIAPYEPKGQFRDPLVAELKRWKDSSESNFLDIFLTNHKIGTTIHIEQRAAKRLEEAGIQERLPIDWSKE